MKKDPTKVKGCFEGLNDIFLLFMFDDRRLRHILNLPFTPRHYNCSSLFPKGGMESNVGEESDFFPRVFLSFSLFPSSMIPPLLQSRVTVPSFTLLRTESPRLSDFENKGPGPRSVLSRV